MSMRDYDLVNTFLRDKRTVINKMNFYANQVSDPSLKALIQDCANIHNRHVQILNEAQSRIASQPGQAPAYATAGQSGFAGASWGAYTPIS